MLTAEMQMQCLLQLDLARGTSSLSRVLLGLSRVLLGLSCDGTKVGVLFRMPAESLHLAKTALM